MAISLVADVFDGAAARMLNVASPIGKVLDSLADLVSFCVMPGVVTYQVWFASSVPDYLGVGAVVFYVLMGCLRLARFTVNDDEKVDFKGLPTPASAIALVSLWLLFMHYNSIDNTLPLVLGLIILGSLNVSTITMLSLKDIASNRFKQIAFSLMLIIGMATCWVNPYCTLVTMLSVYLMISIFYHIRFAKELSRH